MPAVLPKIRQARELLDEVNPQARIMVDGGVDDQTTPELVAAGAEILICGSYIFQHPDGLAAAIQSSAKLWRNSAAISASAGSG